MYDAIIIGAGPGGHAAALEAARCGKRTAVIEKNQWGGTCTYKGCIPTKALLACSRQYQEMKKSKRLGVTASEYSFDYAAMKRHQQQIIRVSSLGVQKALKDAGVEAITGEGEIVAPGQVLLKLDDGSQKILRARVIVIAWGSRPALPPGISVSPRVLTSDQLLAMENFPKSIIIAGGSIIGVEFATLLAELNAKVSIVELLEQILPTEDEEAASVVKQELIRLGVEIHTGTCLAALHETPASVTIDAAAPSGSVSLTADYVLVSTGRKAVLRTDELELAGVRYDDNGIAVDEYLATSVEGIYAVGDVTGGMMLAHRAMHQGRVLANRLFGDRSLAYRENCVPSVVYSHPSIARVGLTEKAARELGIETEIVKCEFAANALARAQLQGQGFAKMIFHQDCLVGCTICGGQAAELISSASLAVSAGMRRSSLRNWIIPHPTLSEVLTL